MRCTIVLIDTSDMCDNYDTYFACIDAAGCWSDTYNTECTSVKSDASCSSLSCYGGASKNYYFTDASTKTQYSSFVFPDLTSAPARTSFSWVNCISALGAFASSVRCLRRFLGHCIPGAGGQGRSSRSHTGVRKRDRTCCWRRFELVVGQMQPQREISKT